MPKGKQKGNTFERHCAKLILKAAGSSFGKKDCYRVPMSGGHQFEGEGDLRTSKRMRKVFPFLVEAKHRKTIKPYQFFNPTEELYGFIRQSKRETRNDKWKRPGLIVVKGNNTPIFAMVRLEMLDIRYCGLLDHPMLRIRYKGRTWGVTLFSNVLNCLTKIIQKENKK